MVDFNSRSNTIDSHRVDDPTTHMDIQQSTLTQPRQYRARSVSKVHKCPRKTFNIYIYIESNCETETITLTCSWCAILLIDSMLKLNIDFKEWNHVFYYVQNYKDSEVVFDKIV